ncbi:hypothetical protein QCA50_011903 [Cerrena zonata]|uniref:Cytochrome P450 n=1 Tax=Cerrena zonata TaxID=2478898 RepID=A0AAW0G5S2_9APHY
MTVQYYTSLLTHHPELLLGSAAFWILPNRAARGDFVLAAIFVGFTLLVVQYHRNEYYRTWSETCLHAMVTLGTGLVALVLNAVLYRSSPWHPLSQHPGPFWNRITEIPLALSAYRRDRFLYVRDLHERYGKIVRIAPNAISINSSAAVNPIYGSSQCFNKSDAYDLHMKGDGLFFIKEREWHDLRRRSWNRAFSSEAMVNYRDVLVSTSQTLVDYLLRCSDRAGAVTLDTCLSHWSFDTMVGVVFGGKQSEESLMHTEDPFKIVEEARNALVAFEFLGHLQWLFHILKHFPSSQFRRFESFSTELARRRLEAKEVFVRDVFSFWVLSFIDKSPEDNIDIFLQLDAVADESDVKVEDLAVDSEVAIIAGTESVASMSSILFYFILTHQEWYHALRDELDTTFQESEFDVDVLDNLPILNAIIQEGMRLGSIFSGLQRVVPPEGAFIEGCFFPGGTLVGVPIYAQHTSEENFSPSPREFRPQRWLKGGLGPDSKINKSSMLTFSAGPFSCVGSKLAYKQIRTVLANVLLQLDVSFPPGFDPNVFWGGVRNLRATILTEHLMVNVKPRDGRI